MKNKITFKLSHKLILSMALFSLLGLMMAFLVVNLFIRDGIYDNVLSSVQNRMTVYATELDGWFTNSKHILDTMAATFENIDHEEMRRLSVPLVNAHEYIIMMFVGFANNNSVISGQLPEGWIPPPGFYVGQRPWHVVAMENRGATAFTEPYVSGAYPYSLVVSAGRSLPGVGADVVLGIDIVLDDIMTLLASYDVPGGGYLFLLSQEGDVVSHPQEEVAPTFEGMRNIGAFPGYAALSGILDGRYGTTRFISPNGIYSYMMTFPIPSTGWTLVSVFPVDVTESAVSQVLFVVLLTFFLIFAAFSVIVIMLIMSSVFKPINHITAIVSDVRNGKLDVNDGTKLKHDEIGNLARDIYGLVNVIKGIMQDLTKINHEFNVVGDIEYRADAGKYKNSYKAVVESINDILNYQVEDMMNTLKTMNQIADGEFDAPIKDLPGKKNTLPQTMRSVINTLKELNSSAMYLARKAAKGSFEDTVDEAKFKGSWAELAHTLNSLMDAVNEPLSQIEDNVVLMSQGDFSLIEGDFKGRFDTVVNACNLTNETTLAYIHEIENILVRVAKGDLTVSVNRDFIGSYEPIKIALTTIVESLSKIMSNIQSATGQVVAGAEQINQGAMQLADGASRQNTAIQALSDSIQVIDQKAKESATSATDVSNHVVNSTEYAKQGDLVVKSMLTSMGKVKESSNDISKIIKVISDIAFQTNLLALNAAVEAARAGEHGKGFSVVAEEVRSLAGRSQQSTGETTVIIERNGRNADNVLGDADKVADSFATIAENINQMSDTISTIVSMSLEQADSISAINDNISEISKVVQENSASAQESAAASEELNSQAEMLRQTVEYFKLRK